MTNKKTRCGFAQNPQKRTLTKKDSYRRIETTIGGFFMGKHYGHVILEKVLELKQQGKTHREIGKEFGLTEKQISKLVERNNIHKRKIEAGMRIRKKGRPRKNSKVTKKEKIAELRYTLNRKEYRIKQLEMENELLRDFLCETGRG